MSKAITFSLRFLSGVIASSALMELAIALPQVEIFFWVVGLIWALTLTDHGHNAIVQTFRLSDAQVGALRLLILVAFVAGLAVNLAFMELPSWLTGD